MRAMYRTDQLSSVLTRFSCEPESVAPISECLGKAYLAFK